MKPELKLNVLIYKEKEEYVAHCLEMDLVAVNSSINNVKIDIEDIIKSQILTAIEDNNLENLFKFAPIEIWKKADKIKTLHYESQKIQLKPKKRIIPKFFPISQLELCFAN